MELTGIIHAHSTHSYDGKVSLLSLKRLFTDQGIHFVCLSEHTDTLTPEAAAVFVAECREISDESFLCIPGFEMPYKDAHILLLGCTEFPGPVAADAAALRAAASAATLTILAHPVRNHFVLDEAMRESIDGVEIWNQQYDGKWVPRSRSASLLTQLRTDNPQLLAAGGLDFHRIEHFGAPLTKLTVETFSEASILATLREGRFQFGTDQLSITATETWQPTALHVGQSSVAIKIITSGKVVNRLLASLGVSLPKSLKQFIRRLV